MKLCEGDQVEVRDRGFDPWVKGTVMQFNYDGGPGVKRDDMDQAHLFKQVSPIVGEFIFNF